MTNDGGMLLGTPTATLEAARVWARRCGAARMLEVDQYLHELWRLGTRLGYDPAVAAAHASVETEGWTSALWRDRLNPARIGVSDVHDLKVHFVSGVDAARAHLVHLSALARGYDRRLQPFLRLDPSWQDVFVAGVAGRVKTLGQLAAQWSPDPDYGRLLIQHWHAIREAYAMPIPVTQPTRGGAPLPAGITRYPCGNWSERTFGQEPVAIVFHATDDPDLGWVTAWYQNPASRSSVHAVVDEHGGIHQFVSDDRASWANSDPKNPRRDFIWLNNALARCHGEGGPMRLDDFTLAIAFLGLPERGPTEEQYRSMIALCAYWRDRFHIPIDRSRLLCHSDINSVDRARCPGPRFDLARMLAALGDIRERGYSSDD